MDGDVGDKREIGGRRTRGRQHVGMAHLGIINVIKIKNNIDATKDKKVGRKDLAATMSTQTVVPLGVVVRSN